MSRLCIRHLPSLIPTPAQPHTDTCTASYRQLHSIILTADACVDVTAVTASKMALIYDSCDASPELLTLVLTCQLLVALKLVVCLTAV